MATEQTTKVPLTVYFKPRLHHVDSTNRLLAAGSEYGPFHTDHGPLPDDATERKDIHCSSSIIQLWSEFHSTIRPLIQLPPSPVNGASRRATYITLLQREENEHQAVKKFIRRVAPVASALYVSLFRPTPAPKNEREVYNAILVLELPTLDLDDAHIEFAIIASVFVQLCDYFDRYRQFAVEVIRPCSPWEHVYVSGTHLVYRIARSLKGASPAEAAQGVAPVAGYPSSESSPAEKFSNPSPELGIGIDSAAGQLSLSQPIDRPSSPEPSPLRRRQVGSMAHRD